MDAAFHQILERRYVIPFVDHAGAFPGFFTTSVSKNGKSLCVLDSALSQKFSNLLITGDLHLCDFLSAVFTSSSLISSISVFQHSRLPAHIPLPILHLYGTLWGYFRYYSKPFYFFSRMIFLDFNLIFSQLRIEFFGVFLESLILPIEICSFGEPSDSHCFQLDFLF